MVQDGIDLNGDSRGEELAAILREIRERVEARRGQKVPDLTSLLHARDAAQARVAAIGTVNPRPGGLLNRVVQGAKKLTARALDWHVREQVEFNRHIMMSVEAIYDALADYNRLLAGAGYLQDIVARWQEWHTDWERRLNVNETQFLRSVAELEGAFQHRATLMETNFREMVQSQHADYRAALDRSGEDVQRRLWADLEKIQLHYERLIHEELRIVRQRAAVVAQTPAPIPAPPAPPPFDYGRFAERFRGSEEYVRNGQRFYLQWFSDCRDVLDIGCGRGEFLELMRESGVPARGIDLSDESVELCRHKGLAAEKADLFLYLGSLPDTALDGIFSAQVVEHLAPERLPEMIRLCAAKLTRGGVLAIETPNPRCLAIFATHFYLDPTHTRPIPHQLLAFYMEEFGLGGVEVHALSPAADSTPALRDLPQEFREDFFGGLDYAIIARKL